MNKTNLKEIKLNICKDGKFESNICLNDIVLFSKYGGTEILIDNVQHKLLNVDDIMAKIID